MTRTGPTIASLAISKLLELTPSLGLDNARLADDASLDLRVLADRDARVPLGVLHQLWTQITARTQRRDLPLVLATRYAPADYGLVGFVCANSETLGEALGHLVRYFRLWVDEPHAELSGPRLIFRYGAGVTDSVGRQCATEAGFAEILNAIAQLAGRPLRPAAVSFAHAAVRPRAAHDAYFGRRVQFDAPSTELVFTAAQLGMALPRADPRLGALLRAFANDALARRGAPEGICRELSALFAERLQHGGPTAREAARALHLSERTLRRRLEEEGTTFTALLDATRTDLACAYLRDRRLAMSEVAFLLGFSEPSAFHRAFKRWTQQTPATYRAQHARAS